MKSFSHNLKEAVKVFLFHHPPLAGSGPFGRVKDHLRISCPIILIHSSHETACCVTSCFSVPSKLKRITTICTWFTESGPFNRQRRSRGFSFHSCASSPGPSPGRGPLSRPPPHSHGATTRHV